MKPVSFKKMLKGKVIIAFLIACTALFFAWSVSNIAFREMLGTVQGFSEPNEKLSVVNNLYRRITLLEQFQRSSSTDYSPETYNRFRKESRLLRHSLDTLKLLYTGNKVQIGRINTMKTLLQRREKLFSDYLLVREAIVNNKVLDGEVSNLNEILLDNSKLPDSTTVWKSENKFTTTVIPAKKEETPVGLLRRIFGKKKPMQTDTTPQKIINEELSITIDTITTNKKDSLFKTVDSVLVNLQKKQKEQSGQFISREKQLSDASHILVNQMLNILEQVEKEVFKQAKANHSSASLLVSDSSRQIKLIICAFFLVTAFLLYFILTDITRNNKYRQMLEHANQEASYHSMAKQRFLSNMSHEIRTPLQAIMGYAELARQEDETGKKNINAIYSSSGHLLQIVNEVLDYSNIISGKFAFNNSVFCLNDLLDEVISVMKVQAEKKSLSLIKDYALSHSLYLEGDPFRLKQIIYNLLGNALKFTEKGSVKLSVSGKEHQDKVYLMINVEDTGIGMTEKDIAHVFGEFERGENTVSHSSSGTGLGLSIVKTLVSNLSGRIYVKSKPENGSCFTIYLPFIKSKKPEDLAGTGLRQIPKIYPGKVWMVDDDKFILELCSSIFEKNGISYKCFNDPLAVLEEEPDENLSCVLLDMRMPGMDGAELCSLLRKKLPGGMYIFALTAQALPWEQESILRQGFDGLLMKPFKEAELLDLIFSTVERLSDGNHSLIPDFTSVNVMAFGDPSRTALIFKQFTDDSLEDSKQLSIAMEKEDIDYCLLLLHRIAGRTAQIGSGELAADFRMAEIMISQSGKLSLKSNGQIRELLGRLHTLSNNISEIVHGTMVS